MAYRPPSHKRQPFVRSKSPPPLLADATFPSLCQSIPQESSKAPAFAEIFKIIVRSEVISSEDEETDNVVPAGWVSAKLTDVTRRKVKHISKEQKILSPRDVEKGLAKMVARWQNHREEENELLGDRSYYWNRTPLGEDSEEDLS